MTTRPKLPVKMPGQLLDLQNGGSNASIPVAQWPGQRGRWHVFRSHSPDKSEYREMTGAHGPTRDDEKKHEIEENPVIHDQLLLLPSRS